MKWILIFMAFSDATNANRLAEFPTKETCETAVVQIQKAIDHNIPNVAKTYKPFLVCIYGEKRG